MDGLKSKKGRKGGVCVMRWLSVCVSALVWVTAAPAELRCDHPCVDGAAHKIPHLGFARTFMIEDNRIDIYYKAYRSSFIFSLNCHGHRALDYSESNPLPSFRKLFRVHTVVLESCPPPTGRSYRDALAAFNVTLESIPPNNHTYLKLVKLLSHPKLHRGHFAGLEHLTNLTIDNEVKLDHPSPDLHFLWPLRNLIELKLKRIKIPFSDTPHNITSKTIIQNNLVTELYKNYGKDRKAERVTFCDLGSISSNNEESYPNQNQIK